jgi:molybdenum-dependent DNA-binding transcriptional regulator ModE
MVTDRQVRRLFMLINKEKSLSVSASKAGMDEKTARKYL